MAKLESPLPFTGSIGNLSAYAMRGVDKIVLRSKGGASKDRIRKDPNFDLVRRNNAEFGGRAQASKFIMRALWRLKPLADYNIAGPLNSLLTRIQKLDEVSVLGQRNVALSKNPKLLEGFSLNRKSSFDSVVRNALTCTMSHDHPSAELEIPALVPDVNLFTPKSHSYFSIIFTLHVVPDIFYTENGYVSSLPVYQEAVNQITTPWYATRDGSPVTTLQLTVPSPPPNQSYSLLAAVGIRYGSPTGDEIMQVRYAGSAKVCGMG